MNICVIGAGNGGQALAGYLALKGFDVSLFNKSKMRILPIMKTRKIRLEGEVNATAQVSFATTNLAEAVRGRKLLMVVVPANVHREIAEKLAPLLEDGQIVVLNPGRTAGALEFVNVLNEKGVEKRYAGRGGSDVRLHFMHVQPWRGAHLQDQKCCTRGGFARVEK